MLYLVSENGDFRFVILETKNIEDLLKGVPLKTPDRSCVLAWTPDPVWLADRLRDTNGDPKRIAELVEEAAKRPYKGPRPHHEPHVYELREDDKDVHD